MSKEMWRYHWFLLTLSCLMEIEAVKDPTQNIRLPGTILPEHYYVGMVPNLSSNNGSLDGFVHVNIFVQNSTKRIIMHAVDLTLFDDTVVVTPLQQQEKIEIKTPVLYDRKKEFLIIELQSELTENHRYRISFNYSGYLSTNLKGFYRSEYYEHSTGSRKWLGVTQFEPTAARAAFPCFDEPAMKATFTIALGRHANFSSLSNMPLARTEPMNDRRDWFWDSFEKSVPMSTYLVACFISQFNSRKARSLIRSGSNSTQSKINATEIRIWARPEALYQADKAVDVTPIMLEFLEKYFQVEFPLPKVDLVALSDFSSSAMENWGLLTYRETSLLVDPKTAALRHEMNVERVIAHELAHQWFGNLVTMKWWNDLWLNEGFATYVQRVVLDSISPNYEYGVLQTLDFFNVMEADGLNSSHPISVTVEHPTQITEIFDAISYTKGAAIIRMMKCFLGENTFRKGISSYLQQKKYGNAEQDELWGFLTEQGRTDNTLPINVGVKDVMDTWTLQKGFPLVTVTRNYSENTVEFHQVRFLRTSSTNLTQKSDNTNKSLKYRWWIPVSITDGLYRNFSEENTRPVAWLNPSDHMLSYSTEANATTWIIANVRASGYYRVNYDNHNWALIEKQLKENHNAIHPINRASLIDDAFALAASGYLPYPSTFDLIEYLLNEDHYVPWGSALRALNYIGRMFSYTKDYGRFRGFMRSLVFPAYQRFGSAFQTNGSPILKFLRATLISQACSYENKICVRQAQNQFDTWMESNNVLHFTSIIPDLRPSILCTSIKYGGQLEWDFLWKASQNMTNAQDRDVMLTALGCSRDPWNLKRYMSFVLDPKSGIRKQDGRRVVSAVAGNSAGRRIAFEFVMNNFDEMFSYFGNPVRVLQMFSSTTNGLNTQEELAKVQSFLKSKTSLLKTAQTSANNIESVVAANVHWMNSNYDSLNKWFTDKGF